MKKLLTSALVIAMMCSMAACSTDATDGSADSSTDSSSSGDSTSSDTTENITLTLGVDASTDTAYPEGDSLDYNAWTRAYEDYGVTVEYTMVASGDAYQQKVALAMISDDLPDMWQSNSTNFYEAVSGGYAYDLTGMKEEYLSDLSKSYTDEYELPFECATVDGKEYAWPALSEDPTAGTSQLTIRMDWLENLGLDVPETQQELVDALIAFAQDDPDGNGVDDTYGLAIDQDLWEQTLALEGFFNSYHAYPNIWYEVDGELVYGSVQAEEMKAALADLQLLYEAGAIDPEFIIKDQTAVEADEIAGTVGASYNRWWIMGGTIAKSYLASDLSNPDMWGQMVTPSIDEDPALLQTSASIATKFYVVNADCENPEAIYTLINCWFDNMFSPDLTQEQYTTYAMDEGFTIQGYAWVSPWPYVNPILDYFQAVIDGEMEPEDLTGEAASKWADMESYFAGDITQLAYDAYWNYYLGEEYSASAVRLEYVESENYIEDAFYGESTDTMVDKMSTLETLFDQTVIEIITGVKSVDEFDDFVEDWYALGGQDIVDEVNEWYQSTL